jgi:hypothetical protein
MTDSARLLRLTGPFGRNNTPSMASQPSPHIHVQSFGRFDEITDSSIGTRPYPRPVTHKRHSSDHIHPDYDAQRRRTLFRAALSES